jgi:hypothetical protein
MTRAPAKAGKSIRNAAFTNKSSFLLDGEGISGAVWTSIPQPEYSEGTGGLQFRRIDRLSCLKSSYLPAAESISNEAE